MNVLTILDDAYNLAKYYYKNDEYKSAIRLLKLALKGLKKILPAQHSDTLKSTSLLAASYYHSDDRGSDINLLFWTLMVRKKYLGDVNHDTLHTAHKLSASYCEIGDLEKAIELGEWTLAGRKKLLGNDNIDTLVTAHNLSASYGNNGDYVKAIELGEWTLAGRINLLGDNHLDTLSTAYNLSQDYYHTSAFKKAASLIEMTLDGLKECLIAKHPIKCNFFERNTYFRYYSNFFEEDNLKEIFYMIISCNRLFHLTLKYLSLDHSIKPLFLNLELSLINSTYLSPHLIDTYFDLAHHFEDKENTMAAIFCAKLSVQISIKKITHKTNRYDFSHISYLRYLLLKDHRKYEAMELSLLIRQLEISFINKSMLLDDYIDVLSNGLEDALNNYIEIANTIKSKFSKEDFVINDNSSSAEELFSNFFKTLEFVYYYNDIPREGFIGYKKFLSKNKMYINKNAALLKIIFDKDIIYTYLFIAEEKIPIITARSIDYNYCESLLRILYINPGPIEEIKDLCSYFYEKIINKEIRKFVNKKNYIYFSLDRELRNLPMSILYNKKSKKWLAQTHSSIMFSDHIILMNDFRNNSAISSKQGFRYGRGKTMGNNPDLTKLSSQVFGFGCSEILGNNPHLADLNHVEDELSSIIEDDSEFGILRDRGLDRLPGKLILNSDFTAQALSDALKQKITVLHIASHFVFDDNNPKESYLLLGDGKRLTLSELSSKPDQYPLDSLELLTLSCCRTAAVAKEENGSDLESFAALAIERGAEAVLATLGL
jgi:CHAT domain-containing protein